MKFQKSFMRMTLLRDIKKYKNCSKIITFLSRFISRGRHWRKLLIAIIIGLFLFWILINILLYTIPNCYPQNLIPTTQSVQNKNGRGKINKYYLKQKQASTHEESSSSINNFILEASTKIRNIPLPPSYILGMNTNGPNLFHNLTCSKFPTLFDLEFNNIYWQTLRTSNGTLHLYGAYLDIRKQNLLGPTIRILGMMDQIEPNVTSFCQIWFSSQTHPVVTKVLEYKYIWQKDWGNYQTGIFQPYLLSCVIPRSHLGQIPVSVSVVEKSCDFPTNNLRVIFDMPKKKKGFAVCVKGMDFPNQDLSIRLTEWIELLGILGADKIFFYEFSLHSNVRKVLEYYEKKGQVDVTPLTLPGGQPNDPLIRHLYLKRDVLSKRQNELIPYNDCLYRNLYKYDYLTLLDIDEVIMPMISENWQELMIQISRQAHETTSAISNYYFQHFYFMDEMMDGKESSPEIPDYFHMLQHIYRSKNHTRPGRFAKCFHNPERVLVLHNHFPLACINGSCLSYPMRVAHAHLQHYREGCVEELQKRCDHEYRRNPVKDIVIWRYKDILIERVNEALNSLGLLYYA